MQSIVMPSQDAPELILNLCDSVFRFEGWIAIGLFAVAVIMDGINYRRSRC